MTAGSEIGLRIDQTLIQDATGTMVMLELEALGLDRVRTQVSVRYVDHNLLQADERNMADHLFLRSACQRLGVWYSRPGNGVSHPVHMERFGRPGASLAGSDSHTCAAGSLGMLAIGVGGLEVAMAMAGQPLSVMMPQIWGVRLTGALPPWVSAKDVILEMLRRHGVKGGVGRIIEYHGPGLDSLSAMDRHVIANMGAELGATTSVFPADEQVRAFLGREGRGGDFTEVRADPDASYDVTDEIDLGRLEPLIARPSSPGNVVPVREVAGEPVYQVVVGSSANPGLRDFAVLAAITAGRSAHPQVSMDVNPTSRQILADLTAMGGTLSLIRSGARIHQAGCMGCIGMGQAPAIGRNSLRTVPRNFPGRSGTDEDSVLAVFPGNGRGRRADRGDHRSPRPAVAARHRLPVPGPAVAIRAVAVRRRPDAPGGTAARSRRAPGEAGQGAEHRHPSRPGPDAAGLRARVAIKVGDNISTDEILPAGARVLPFRSDVPRLAGFTFSQVDEGYVQRAREAGTHAVVAGENHGQGSSREHAVIAPRHLGLRLVIAKSYARIHWQNLANFGVLAAEFADPADYDRIDSGDDLSIDALTDALGSAAELTVHNRSKNADFTVRHRLSPRQVAMVLAGGQIPLVRNRA